MTDVLLTSLMCAPRSVYSWDIVVTRAGDKLFFDKRDGSNLDFLTVAETAPESVLEEKDNINGVQQLSQEATAVNQAFSQQVRRAWECALHGGVSVRVCACVCVHRGGFSLLLAGFSVYLFASPLRPFLHPYVCLIAVCCLSACSQ